MSDKLAFQPPRGRGTPDPIQKRLRLRKKQWNIKSRQFIPRLIAFKQSLNGRAIPLFGLPGSNIKDPVPNEVANFLSQLAADFDWLVNEADGILQEQNEYSMHRRKSQKEATVENIPMIIEASSKWSRFWARISSLFASDEFKHHRLALLNVATRLFKNLVELEDLILRKGTENIPDIINSYFIVMNNFKTFKLMFDKVEEKLKTKAIPSEVPSPNIPSEKPQLSSPLKQEPISSLRSEDISSEPETEEPINIKHLLSMALPFTSIGFPATSWSKLSEMHYKAEKEKDPNRKAILQDVLQIAAEEQLKKIRKMLDEEYDIQLSPTANLETYAKALNMANKSKAACIDHQLTKTGSYLSRLINYYRHRYGLKDETSALRIEIYAKVRETKIELDKIMDGLEASDVSLQELSNKVRILGEHIASLKDPIELLHTLHFDILLKRRDQKHDPAADYLHNKFKKQMRYGF